MGRKSSRSNAGCESRRCSSCRFRKCRSSRWMNWIRPSVDIEGSGTQDTEEVSMMERTNVLRNTLLALALASWAFLLLALGSFSPTDWPSHTVFPYPATANLCGTVGAYVAYWCFFAIGQG